MEEVFEAVLDELRKAKKVIGVKQTTRALQDGSAASVYIALDAETRLTDPVRALAGSLGVPVTDAETMRALGQACGIAVGAAVAAVLKG